jgi:YspA, cpYpsA-related SLOG family
MRVLVCGSRTFSDQEVIMTVLDGILEQSDVLMGHPMTVIEGGASGADEFAGDWAEYEVGLVFHERYPADWQRDGRAAGPIRNQRMLDVGKPDVVWAFVDRPLAESQGTADMVRRARKAGIPTYVVEVQ